MFLISIFFLPFVFGDVSIVNSDGTTSHQASSIVLNELPYEYNALEPYLSEQTMRIHHDKHHAKVESCYSVPSHTIFFSSLEPCQYVATANSMIQGTDLENLNIIEIIRRSYGLSFL
jgi:hypothetical protein